LVPLTRVSLAFILVFLAFASQAMASPVALSVASSVLIPPDAERVEQSRSPVQVSIDAGSGVNVKLPGYTPDKITVVIGVNNTVKWTNNDNMPHTVTASDGSFDSGNLNPGQSYIRTFNKTGTYSYICTYHLWMGGSVTVLGVSSQPQAAGIVDFFTILVGVGALVLAMLVLVLAKRRKNRSTSG